MTPEHRHGSRRDALRQLLVDQADQQPATSRRAGPRVLPLHVRAVLITAGVAVLVGAVSAATIQWAVHARSIAAQSSAPVTSLPPSFNAMNPRDLNAVCAIESEVQTIALWRQQQTEAKRLDSSQSRAVLQTIAVLYLEMPMFGVPAAVRPDVTTLHDAAGTLEHPTIDLASTVVLRAKERIARTCQDNGLTVGAIGQGG